MRRILVGGVSGSGKTTVARELAQRLELPFHGTDALVHRPGADPDLRRNTERFSDWLDPEHPVQWSMRQYWSRRAEFETPFADPRYAVVTKVGVRWPVAARWWLDRISGADGGSTWR